MSSSWANLPNELLKEVFSYIGSSDLLNAEGVCRRWKPVAQEFLYSDIDICANGASSEQLLVQTLSDFNCEAQHYVKRLTIDRYNYVSGKNFTSLANICSMCPNIISISIREPSKQFYHLLGQLLKSGYLQKIQNIPEPSSLDCITEYSDAILLMKTSATEINIFSDPAIAIPDHGSILDAFPVAQHLNDFCCLEKVVISTSANDLKAVHVVLRDLGTGQPRRRLTSTKQASLKPPGRMLSAVKELLLMTDVLLTDQDLKYIMEKFPALENLETCFGSYTSFSNDRDYTFISSIQSTDTVLKFVQYLWRIPCCYSRWFRIAPEVMFKAISQTAKCRQINSLSIESVYQQESQFTSFGVIGRSSKQTVNKCICLCIPPGMEALYQHALEAFSSQVEDLDLIGSTQYDEQDVYIAQLGEEETADDETVISSLEFALTNYNNLKRLRLSWATLPWKFSNKHDESTKKLRLDNLTIETCSLKMEAFSVLSERLEYVEELWLERNIWESEFGYLEEIYMPQTAFGKIFVSQEHNFHYRCKISTKTTITYIDFQHGEMFGEEPERLTKEQYEMWRHRHYNETEYFIEIDCAAWSTISFNNLQFRNGQ
ncbi:hypothetical protein MBANPS3_006950 [Mucor bainieri]